MDRIGMGMVALFGDLRRDIVDCDDPIEDDDANKDQ